MVETREAVNNVNTNLIFIVLVSDTTFKYLYKNEKTRVWFNNIIKDKFNLDLTNFKLIDNEVNTGNNLKDYRMDLVSFFAPTRAACNVSNFHTRECLH